MCFAKWRAWRVNNVFAIRCQCHGSRSMVALLRFKVFEELAAIAALFANAA
jgi:hypothetical protein